MPETINLIPQEERVQQTKTKVVKMSTILSVVLLVIIGGLGGFFFFKTYTLKQDIAGLETDINGLREEITKLKNIEINARNLNKKTDVLRSVFESRNYYSRLVIALHDATPSSVVVDSFGLGKDTTIGISGKADTYAAVQEFTDMLLKNELFTAVTLNSVGLENRLNRVTFFVVVTYKEDLLHE